MKKEEKDRKSGKYKNNKNQLTNIIKFVNNFLKKHIKNIRIYQISNIILVDLLHIRVNFIDNRFNENVTIILSEQIV